MRVLCGGHTGHCAVYMAPATAIADGRGERAFADCPGKTGNKIPIKLPKLDDFYDINILKSKDD